jgi:hypothetical protein
MGQVVYQQHLKNPMATELDLSGILNEAVYIVSIESENSKIFTKLIVK